LIFAQDEELVFLPILQAEKYIGHFFAQGHNVQGPFHQQKIKLIIL
jgi:hypothetical protein